MMLERPSGVSTRATTSRSRLQMGTSTFVRIDTLTDTLCLRYDADMTILAPVLITMGVVASVAGLVIGAAAAGVAASAGGVTASATAGVIVLQTSSAAAVLLTSGDTTWTGGSRGFLAGVKEKSCVQEICGHAPLCPQWPAYKPQDRRPDGVRQVQEPSITALTSKWWMWGLDKPRARVVVAEQPIGLECVRGTEAASTISISVLATAGRSPQLVISKPTARRQQVRAVYCGWPVASFSIRGFQRQQWA